MESKKGIGESGLEENSQPLLVFFSSVSSGPARRMDSLVAHLARKERRRLRVLSIDVDLRPDLAERFQIGAVPTLLLVKDRRVVERIEGRASASKIEHALEPHLAESATLEAVA
jgi:thioredoxin 2